MVKIVDFADSDALLDAYSKDTRTQNKGLVTLNKVVTCLSNNDRRCVGVFILGPPSRDSTFMRI